VATKKTSKVNSGAKATINHDEIREWVESHGGHPAMVKSTARNGRGGILRIDFPGFSGQRSLEEVSWEDFFDKFEESELAFLHRDQTASARPSRFNKLVSRASVADGQGGRASSPRARPQKNTKKAARRATTSTGGATKKRPAKRASTAQAQTPTLPKGARRAKSAANGNSSARGAGQRGGTPKRKSSRQTQEKRPTQA